jgi:hypothetical protein
MTASATQHYDIVEHTLEAYTRELRSRLLDGWDISPTNRGDVVGLYGGTFTVSLYRNVATVETTRKKVAAIADAPKPDRGAILAAARAAKAAKKKDSVT